MHGVQAVVDSRDYMLGWKQQFAQQYERTWSPSLFSVKNPYHGGWQGYYGKDHAANFIPEGLHVMQQRPALFQKH